MENLSVLRGPSWTPFESFPTPWNPFADSSFALLTDPLSPLVEIFSPFPTFGGSLLSFLQLLSGPSWSPKILFLAFAGYAATTGRIIRESKRRVNFHCFRQAAGDSPIRWPSAESRGSSNLDENGKCMPSAGLRCPRCDCPQNTGEQGTVPGHDLRDQTLERDDWLCGSQRWARRTSQAARWPPHRRVRIRARPGWRQTHCMDTQDRQD